MASIRTHTLAEPAILVEGLSKRYRIGRRRGHSGLHERIETMLRAPFRRASSLLETGAAADARPAGGAGRHHRWIWAVKDVSFSVGRGEIVGIVGHNGAGKSVLLKILSRITRPTGGRAELRGHVGAMLEVGTGFHPELNGVENVYLSGAILGMTRAEIARKFDAIVAFSEVEEFLYTPVKHFSSGMRVRLAFSIAAHLEPEILLIDEVLSVGDARFRAKCLAKVQTLVDGGRTVLFVSHHADVLRALATRLLLMDHGRLVMDGPADAVLARYDASGTSPLRSATAG